MDTPATPTPPVPPPIAPRVLQPLADGPVDSSVLAAADGSASPGPGEEVHEPVQHHAAGFFNQPWVQNVLPLATSLALHVAIIVVGILIIRALPAVLASANKEQVIIPQSASLAKSKSPGGVKNPGPPADPNMEARQNQTKDTDNSGFAADATNKLVAATGGAGDTSAGFLGANAQSGSGKTFGSGAGGGGTAPWGVPGGGEGMFPKCEFGGTGGNANDIIFLCDASGSMLSVFNQLKEELLRSVSTISVGENGAQRFNVIFFHDGDADMLFKTGMQVATSENKALATKFIRDAVPNGQTNPMKAIHAALEQKPQLLFVLTDGFDNIADMSTVTNEFKHSNPNGAIKINCIFLQSADDPKLIAALKEIADTGHGDFKAIYKKDM